MAKEDGVRTVVIGGKNDVSQQYCGTVGGQSLGFTKIDTEIKVCFVLNHFRHTYLTWLDRVPSSRNTSLPRRTCT